MNPSEVQIRVTLNLTQTNIILDALGKLPYEQVNQLVVGLRAVALQALQAAEDESTSVVTDKEVIDNESEAIE